MLDHYFIGKSIDLSELTPSTKDNSILKRRRPNVKQKYQDDESEISVKL